MTTSTLAPPTQLEADMLNGLDALNECPECKLGTFALGLFRMDGRAFVECGICERSRDFARALKPNAKHRTRPRLGRNQAWRNNRSLPR